MSCDPFDDRASCARESGVELLLAIAGEFGPADAATTQRRLDDFALPLFGLADEDAGEQAAALLALMAVELRFVACAGDDPRQLLLPHVVDSRRGHPLMLAVVGREIARRAGVGAAVFSSPQRWFVGLQADEHLLLLDASLRDADQAPIQVRPHCRHELACCALTGLSRSFASHGRLDEARRAARRKLTLPIADGLRSQVRRELEALDRAQAPS
jgi:hypothetical protein